MMKLQEQANEQLTQYDELNSISGPPTTLVNKSKYDEIATLIVGMCANGYQSDEVIQLIESELYIGYEDGRKLVSDQLDYYAGENEFDTARTEDLINEFIAGETMQERVVRYLDNGDIDKVITVAQTEFHRLFTTGANDRAREIADTGRVVLKKWNTMLDDKVRDTHQVLEGEAIALDEYFTTYDGDMALYPGDFESAENNVNCRCTLTYVYE